MSVTYTTAAERDRRGPRRVAWLDRPEPLLAAVSLVVVLAIGLACVGRLRVVDAAGRGGVDSIANLNTAREPAALEPALAAAFSNPNDRRFAADELFRSFGTGGDSRQVLPNVGAISRVTVPAAAIERSKGLEVYAARLADRRDGRVPLFTVGDIAKLKPFLTVRTREEFTRQVWLFAALYIAGFHLVAWLWSRRHVRGDRVLLAAVHLLTGIGFAVLLSRPDPLRDSLLFVRYAETIALGLGIMAALSVVDIAALGFASLSYLPLLAALSLSVLLILFGTGPGSSSAKVNLGPMQPIEGIRLLLALFLAGYFARRWELLREVRGTAIRKVRLPGWLDVPRGEYVLPVLIGVAAALVFFFFQKDLGPALFLCCVFLAVYAIARGRVGMAAVGLLLLALGVYAGHQLNVSATLAERVRMWQSPWDNAVAGGNQITHAIWAMASGGTMGTGLGLGDSRYLPAGHTDLILAAIGEELGALGLVAVAALFAVIGWRGFRIARLAASDYGFFLATTLTLFLILPALIMASGVMGVTPLTGVVTPFLSYGGSAMLANFAALGLLAAVHADRRPAHDFAPFRVPVRVLSGVLGACAVVLVGLALRIQVVNADELAIKPHLGVHADGGRRFEYNPRLLDLVRELPRGTIFDRRGLPLASDDRRALEMAAQRYERLGVPLGVVCPDADQRCYPFGGRTFHILGDVRTGRNWSATNTSYTERDADDRLRGFDDHASTVKTFDRSGQAMYTVHRDYRELLPVFRHRYEPSHAAVAALRGRPRDVHLTVDADLQVRLSAIVAAHARKANSKAAAVVLDADSGAILAASSYPWPASLDALAAVEHDPDSLLDRARYGAYPPGSTFKLVVALAALRQGAGAGRHTCVRLPDGRVGSRIDGWARPVRDDIRDSRPHGTIGLHDALVHSCNAYFAQLAVRLGPEPLLGLAAPLRIPLTTRSDRVAGVRDALPQVGYGQAQVLASPLRMATVAAAIADDGMLHQPYIEEVPGAKPARSPGEPLLDPAGARQLASYMRDAVLTGTGHSLRSHPAQIAGKTGTAEVAGRPSHGWFVGFAPYGSARKRIAFAIVIEHAGYGGATAAPAAGEIVTAAAAAGVIGK